MRLMSRKGYLIIALAILLSLTALRIVSAQSVSTNEVSIKDFGGKGDGMADDTEALSKAITYCLVNNKKLIIPEGTYVIESNKIVITLTGDDNHFTMQGSGKNSTIKRKDNSCLADNMELFTIITKGNSDVESFEVDDIFINDNAAGNPINDISAGAFSYEHSSIFRFLPSSGAKIKQIVFENVIFDDPIADCINFSSSYIGKFVGDKINVLKRNRVRSDICFSNAIENFKLTNSVLTTFEAEWNEAPNFISHVQIYNTVVKDAFDYGGYGDPNKCELVASKCDINFKTIRMADVQISDSTIRLKTSEDIRRTDKTIFTNCRFIHYLTNESAPYDVSYLAISSANVGYPTKVYFKGCRFEIDSSVTAISENSKAVFLNPVELKNIEKQVADFKECWFDERFGCSIYSNRGGTMVSRNCDFAGTAYALYAGGDYDYGTRLFLDGGRFDRMKSAYTIRIDNSPNVSVSFKNVLLPQSMSSIISNEYPVSEIKILDNSRVILCDNKAFKGALKGDIAVMKFSEFGQRKSWKAGGTGNNSEYALWKETATVQQYITYYPPWLYLK